MPMALIPDIAVFQRKLATLPLATYQAGETVLSAASTTGRLLIPLEKRNSWAARCARHCQTVRSRSRDMQRISLPFAAASVTAGGEK
jgi:ribosomal protein S26